MSKAPAVQFYTGDFLTGTALMSNAEVGLYIRLLCIQVEHGSIPDDVERIVQAYGETARALWAGVQPKFIPGSVAGTLVNARMVEVLATRDAFRQRQSEKGKASAEARNNSKRTPEKPRRSRGSTVVEPLGDGEGDRVEVGKEEGNGKTKRAREALPFDSPAFAEAVARWEQHRREKRQALTPTSRTAWLKKCEAMGEARAIEAIDFSIEKGYTGMFEPGNDRTAQMKKALHSADVPADKYQEGI